MNDEKRKYNRVGFTTPISIAITAEGRTVNVQGNSMDLSLKGVFVSTQDVIPVGTTCAVEVSLTGSIEEIILQMNATVVRQTPKGMGIEFDSMDVETYTHLKNIVQYNSMHDSV